MDMGVKNGHAVGKDRVGCSAARPRGRQKCRRRCACGADWRTLARVKSADERITHVKPTLERAPLDPSPSLLLAGRAQLPLSTVILNSAQLHFTAPRPKMNIKP